MKHIRIFTLLGTAVVAVAVLAALMTSMALAHDNILAHVHIPRQAIEEDGDGDTASFFANFHVFTDDRAEGSMQWRDANGQGILHFQNGQVSCVEDRPTFDLLGTLSTESRSGEPDLIQDVAVKVTPIRSTVPLTCYPGTGGTWSCGGYAIDVDPAVYDNFNASGLLALNVDPCE